MTDEAEIKAVVTGPEIHDPAQGDEKSVIETMIDDATGRAAGAGIDVNAVMNIKLNVQVVLGTAKMPISQLLSLSRGWVIELNKKIGEPVDVMINDRLVARANLVKVADNRIGVNLTEIIQEHIGDN